MEKCSLEYVPDCNRTAVYEVHRTMKDSGNTFGFGYVGCDICTIQYVTASLSVTASMPTDTLTVKRLP